MPPEHIDEERVSRRDRSRARLGPPGAPVRDWLPCIENSDEVTIRSVEEIARRAVCLLIAAAKGAGLDGDFVVELVRENGLEADLTPQERVFVFNPEPPEEDLIQFSWRSEAARVLFWALGFIDALGLPSEQSSSDVLVDLLEDNTLVGLIENARTRSKHEILDEADLIYIAHWAVRHGQQTLGLGTSLDPGVTFERHHALNWLIHYEDQEWDEITTDT
jgi:hypothetical protein